MQLTLTISEDAARRISEVTRFSSGTIQGYARKWAEDISRLPISEQAELREILDAKLRRLEGDRAANVRRQAALGATKETHALTV